MDRLEYLQNRLSENSRVVKALLNCLTPQEACDALDRDFKQPPLIRERIVARIVRDMTDCLQDFHQSLLEDLISRLDSLPATKLVSCGCCLETFYRYFDRDAQRRILQIFLYSARKDFRNHAYSIMDDFWAPSLEADVVSVWRGTMDLRCTLLLVKRADAEFINREFDLFYEYLPGMQYMGTLFGRLPNVEHGKLDRLKQDDLVTYTHVMAKLKRPIDEAEAIRIYDAVKEDNRIGILISAFGKLRLWDALLYIEADSVYQGRKVFMD